MKTTLRRTGWTTRLAVIGLAALLYELVSGLAITLLPFHPAVQWNLLAHTVIGLLLFVPIVWYCLAHWLDYRRYTFSHIVLLGYVAVAALLVCLVSGVVVTWQGMFGIRMSPLWRQIHLISTLVLLGAGGVHIALLVPRAIQAVSLRAPLFKILGASAAGIALAGALAVAYSGTRYVNEFPDDYSFLYGEDRPFAPSLAQTTTGGAFDSRSLAGSRSCGTAGCHEQILEEWLPSAHRYAAKDTFFQTIQNVMAEQNGPESTRYCAGCHDPISLFSGTKNIFVENLTNLEGYQEGVSCLACHAIRSTDLRGNAHFVIEQPREYLWQWQTSKAGRLARDFLIRTYPDEHNRLSKRLYKAPEYCAACHKQFIDEEINRVGWVQLQNQYDNWAASHFNQKGDPRKTVECRECHMPLVDSFDPAAGDASDYNRTPRDRKHRSHRFIAANQMMPALLELEGWEEQVRLTEEWLKGRLEIPEISDKWAEGPIVQMALHAPETIEVGRTLPIRVILTSTKVGHDFPTGPLDIIQSWVELHVTDEAGRTVFTSGTRDENHFIEPGSFMFKAEPVDQYGNLIDRHNLWEMVGVRYRRALFPGYSDTVEYRVPVTSRDAEPDRAASPPAHADRQYDVPVPVPGLYRITAMLNYRKIDQFLVNFLVGEGSGITAPVVEIDRVEATVRVTGTGAPVSPDPGRPGGE
jgi:hypothetical protein